MGIEIERLGADAQRQVAAQLAGRVATNAKTKSQSGTYAFRDAFDSQGERDFYAKTVMPLLCRHKIKSYDLHSEFELYPAMVYGGAKFPRAVFKPDFVLHYTDGKTEVVEIKSKFTKRKSRDYTLRRRLFIELYCKPSGWFWTEIVTDKK